MDGKDYFRVILRLLLLRRFFKRCLPPEKTLPAIPANPREVPLKTLPTPRAALRVPLNNLDEYVLRALFFGLDVDNIIFLLFKIFLSLKNIKLTSFCSTFSTFWFRSFSISCRISPPMPAE